MSYLEHRPDRCKTGQDAIAAYEAAKQRRQQFFKQQPKPLPVVRQSEPLQVVPDPQNEIPSAHPLMQLVAAAHIEALGEKPPEPSILDIQRAVCFVWEVSRIDLLSPRRHKKLFIPRQVGFVLCRMLTTHSYPMIGYYFGGRDHSTVVHAIQKFEWLAAELRFHTNIPLVHLAAKARQIIQEREAA